jgi:hypothetical protein
MTTREWTIPIAHPPESNTKVCKELPIYVLYLHHSLVGLKHPGLHCPANMKINILYRKAKPF